MSETKVDKRSSYSIAWIKLSAQLVRKPRKLESKEGLSYTHAPDYIYCQLNLIAQLNLSSNHSQALCLMHTHYKTQTTSLS